VVKSFDFNAEVENLG